MRKQMNFNNTETGRAAVVTRDNHGNYIVTKTGNGVHESSTFDNGYEEDALDDARQWINGHPTNVEVVVQIMNWAKSGPLMQAFIIDALTKQAELVAKSPPMSDSDGMGLVSGRAWTKCAIELRDHLAKSYGR
jgi:hypothetical protein